MVQRMVLKPMPSTRAATNDSLQMDQSVDYFLDEMIYNRMAKGALIHYSNKVKLKTMSLEDIWIEGEKGFHLRRKGSLNFSPFRYNAYCCEWVVLSPNDTC